MQKSISASKCCARITGRERRSAPKSTDAQLRRCSTRGRSLDQIIHSASPARLRAVAAYIDTLPEVVSSNAPDEVVAEVRSLVFDRLAESGDEDAVQVRSAQQAVATPNAWRRVLSEVLEGQPSLSAQTELHQADPEGWAGIDRSEFASADIDVDQRVQALDRVIRSKVVA